MPNPSIVQQNLEDFYCSHCTSLWPHWHCNCVNKEVSLSVPTCRSCGANQSPKPMTLEEDPSVLEHAYLKEIEERGRLSLKLIKMERERAHLLREVENSTRRIVALKEKLK